MTVAQKPFTPVGDKKQAKSKILYPDIVITGQSHLEDPTDIWVGSSLFRVLQIKLS